MFESSFTTNLYQAGPDRKLRPSSLLAIITEAAAADLDGMGLGVEATMKKGLLWVVVKTYAEIDRMPEYKEHIDICCHAGKTRHVLFPRYFTARDGSGKEIIRSSSEWVLMDMEKRSFVFPNEVGISIDGFEPENPIKLPPAVFRKECTGSANVYVPGSYADINGHLNNARYLDLIEDNMPLRQRGCLKTLNIEYVQEILPRSGFTLSWRDDGNSVYVSGDDDRHLFRAQMEYGE